MSWTVPPTKAVDYSKLPLNELMLVKRADVSATDAVIIRDRLLTEWRSYSQILATAKTDEMNIRKAVVGFVTDPSKVAGTENIDLGQGWKLKAVKKENYGFIKDDDGKIDEAAIDRACAKLAKLQNGGYIAERLISWSPSLSVKEFKGLTPEMHKIIDPIVVISAGAPTLEIVAPKGEV